MNSDLRIAFWASVRDSLVEFHHVLEPIATQKVASFRWEVEQGPDGVAGETIYHAEPFDIACDIAGRQLDRTQYRAKYDQLLDRSFSETSTRAVVRERGPGYLPSI